MFAEARVLLMLRANRSESPSINGRCIMDMVKSWRWIAVALGVTACGGGSSSAVANGDGGADASSTGGDSGAGVDSGGSSGGDAAADSAVDGSSAEGGDGGVDDRIDPIVVGRSWTYDVTTFGTYPLCPAGEHTGTATSESTHDGKDHAILVTSLCANAASEYYTVDGDVVNVDYQGAWILALDAPVAEGHVWSNGASTFTWHSAGNVTVAAGTFHDCWTATQNVAYDAYTIFCRGVGPVRWYTKDLGGNGFDAQLKSKNF
jgi:hypothetical protein